MKHSIIIPTAGRSVAAKGAIQSLLALEPEQLDTEILVVDNNTDEALSQDFYDYCMSLEDKVRYIREPSPGLGAARHRGAGESKGEILTFIDDDVEVRSTWLAAIQKGFEDSNVALVGGPSIPKFTGSIPPWFWGYLSKSPYGGWSCSWLSLLDIGKDTDDLNPDYIWGLNFSIRRSVMFELGGFHPDLVPKKLQRWQGDGETGLTRKLAKSRHCAVYRQEAGLFHLCGDDRLNKEYFANRAYYQGVSDSFTRIRGGAAPGATLPHRVLHEIKIRLFQNISKYTNNLRHEAADVIRITDAAYNDGWTFHQTEAANDPELVMWIRRENYFDTDIREFLAD